MLISKSHNMYSYLQLQKRFVRERDRAFRSGAELSLIIFTFTNKRERQDFGKILCQRVRGYDAVGLIDQCHLAVLLPETSNKDAHKFCTACSHSFHQYKIATYPSDWDRHIQSLFPEHIDSQKSTKTEQAFETHKKDIYRSVIRKILESKA